jgi:hypothetical protein
MSLIFVDQEDYNPQQLTDSLYEAQRGAQQLTDRANGTAAVTQQMAQQLAKAGQRLVA